MNRLLRPRIWPSFRASSGIGPCDVPFRYASGSIPRYRGTVARWHAHLRGLVTPIHETSGLGISHRVLNPYPVLQKPALDWKRLASLRLLIHDFLKGSYSLFRVRSHSVVSVDFRVSDDAFLIDN